MSVSEHNGNAHIHRLSLSPSSLKVKSVRPKMEKERLGGKEEERDDVLRVREKMKNKIHTHIHSKRERDCKSLKKWRWMEKYVRVGEGTHHIGRQ